MPHGKSIQKGVYNGNYRHGGKGTKLYEVWYSMIRRCTHKTSSGYENYGGRGISVCEEWQKSFPAFRDWAFANVYSDGLTIDRINNNGNYEPSNCRWATKKEQANNQSTTLHIEYNGVSHTLQEWAELLGINPHTLYARIYRMNWSIERAFTEKVDFDKHHRQGALKGDNNG